MKKARALNKGDKVAIVSLSGGMLGEPFCSHDIELGRKRLGEFGLEMVIMPNALKGISYLKEHPEARADDLKLAFSDSSIKGIICAIGGDDTYRLLPYLLDDPEFIRNVEENPKLFTGFSDTTVNHLMFYKLGLMTCYGPNLINDLAELGNDMLPYTKDAFARYMGIGKCDAIRASEVWYEERTDFSPKSIGTDRKTHQELRGYEVIHGGGEGANFRGRLLGGCLDTLYDLLTGVDNPEAKIVCEKYGIFPDAEEWEGKILFIETSENCMPPERLAKILEAFDSRGIFSAIHGILVGKPQNEVYYEEYKAVYRTALAAYPNLPVLYNVNFGHAYPRTVLAYGAEVAVDVDKREIIYAESFVE